MIIKRILKDDELEELKENVDNLFSLLSFFCGINLCCLDFTFKLFIFSNSIEIISNDIINLSIMVKIIFGLFIYSIILSAMLSILNFILFTKIYIPESEQINVFFKNIEKEHYKKIKVREKYYER